MRNFNFIIGGRFDYWHFRDVLMGAHIPVSWLKLKDEHLFSYRAEVNYNSEDNWLFATRGASFAAKCAYYTDDLVSYKDAVGFSAVCGVKLFLLAECSHFNLCFMDGLSMVVMWQVYSII